MELLAYIVCALCLPLFPLSMGVSYALGKLRGLRTIAFLLLPLAGFYFLGFIEKPPSAVLYISLFTSLLYAFRAVSAESLSRWGIYIFVSAVSLLWLHPSGEKSILGLFYALPFVLLSLSEKLIAVRFGSSDLRLVRGIGLGAPKLGFITTLSILGVIGVPTSTTFVEFLNLLEARDFFRSLILSGVWFFWGWSGVKVLSSIVFGSPREDLSYEDVSLRGGIVLIVLGAFVFGAGYVFFEVLSYLLGWRGEL